MRIAVFGRTGQVATELQRRAPMGISVEAFGRAVADFTRPDEVADVARSATADVLINAAAYTAVDKAESETETAFLVNALSVAALARAAAERNLPLVHISTDYVFDGSGTEPWSPDAPTAPLGAYGRTKLDGENAVRAAEVRHVILRTSWVFSAHGANFVRTMLRLGAERDRLSIVADQVGGPTPAAAIADALFGIARRMADGHTGGTYHFAGTPDTSWADFAREIFRQSGLSPDVADIPSSGYPTPAARPLNSRLDCTSLTRDFGIARPDWKQGLSEVLKELNAT